MIALLLALLAQDPADLIAKLRSADAVEAANAETDLLALGEAARAPLRAAAAGEADAVRKRKLSSLADRLEARKAVASLRTGERWYAVFKEALQIGWVRLKTEEEAGKLRLTDEIQAKGTKVKATQVCEKDEYLSSAELALDIDSPETTLAATGRRKDDRLVFEANGETRALRVGRDTVTDLALLRLVGLLPPTEEYEVELLELLKPGETRRARLKKLIDETVTVEGRALKARQWTLLDGGDEERTYWVDEAGLLLKARFGPVEMTLTTEAKAKDVDTK